MAEPFAKSETQSYGRGDTQTPAWHDSPELKHIALETQMRNFNKAESDDTTSPANLLFEAGYNVAYHGGQSLVRSVGQLTDDALDTGTKYADMVTIMPKPDEAAFRSNRWYAQQLGAGIGFIAPFAITHAGLKTAGLTATARTGGTLASTGKLFTGVNAVRLAEGATTGFISDFTFRPVEESEGNHLMARTKHGFVGAAVMTTMTAGSLGLRNATRSYAASIAGDGLANKTARLVYDGSIGITSGAPAGAASAELNARIWDGRGATGKELWEGAYTMAWTGGALSMREIIPRDTNLGQAAKSTDNESGTGLRDRDNFGYYGNNREKGFLQRSIDKFTDFRIRTKWALQDGYTEARRSTYSLLNDYNMRHPIKRARDFVFPVEVADQTTRAPLTKENNPITVFERELPKYVEAIEAKEKAMDETPDRRKQYEIFVEMREVRTEFALKLLNIWHGNAEQPGIKNHTDAELTNAGATTSRVAQIRNAMTQTAKGESMRMGPMSEAILGLSPKPVDGPSEHYDLLDALGPAKERFYGYNERDLYKKMQMPTEHAIKDHEYGTPVEWFPNQPDKAIPDMYHGTMSGSLPSILTEGTMYHARELRLRGITQKTGESANEQYGRQNISVTRDFNEAFAYHRTSPAYLTDFPVVFGISRDVAPRLRQAGMIEPGELIIDRMKVGPTLLSRAAGRNPDIGHIIVPDSEVPAVEAQLKSVRINGVQVIGLNQLKSPTWSKEPVPEPLPHELDFGEPSLVGGH